MVTTENGLILMVLGFVVFGWLLYEFPRFADAHEHAFHWLFLARVALTMGWLLVVVGMIRKMK